MSTLSYFINGTAEEMAMAICFDPDDSTAIQKEYDALGVPRTDPWESVLIVLRKQLNLPSTATWQEIHAANNRRLATMFGLVPSASWQEIYRKAQRLCALKLGLNAQASWQQICSAHYGD